MGAAALFDYFPLHPGQPLFLGGKRFGAVLAIHTIPSLAVRINGWCYPGDMRYDKEWFSQLVDDGILNKARKWELIQFSEGAGILRCNCWGSCRRSCRRLCIWEIQGFCG